MGNVGLSDIRIELLDIVCHPTSSIPLPHRLVRLTSESMQAISVRTSADGQVIEDAIVWRSQAQNESGEETDCVLAALPEVDRDVEAQIDFGKGRSVKINSAPLKPFEIYIMPTSHLCFGYLTGLPEHIEAGKVVADAVDLIDSTPDYHFSVEYMRGLVNFVQKYPEKLAAARKALGEGRLGISAIWAPSNFEQYDGESHIRQLVESQWWLRDHFGMTSSVALGCDSAGFDPQQPQIFRQSGVNFFWRCRYTLWGKDYGSPFINHLGVDGTSLPCFVSRPPISSAYIFSPVPEMWQSGRKADREDARFGNLVGNLNDYLRQSKEICNTEFNVHFSGGDQSSTDPDQVQRLAAWNRIFRIPSLQFSSVYPMSEKLLSAVSLPQDSQEGEQPHWAPAAVTGSRLTLSLLKASHALLNAEKLASLDVYINSTPYPEAELKAAWVNVLNEQHHEQLGHAAHETVEHSQDLLRRAVFVAEDIMFCSARRIASRIRFRDSEKAPVAVFNTLNWQRRGIVELSLGGSENQDNQESQDNRENRGEQCLQVIDKQGNAVPHEVTQSGTLRFMAEAAAFGYNTYYMRKVVPGLNPASPDLKTGTNFIENEHYRLVVNPETGCVESLIDKELDRNLLTTRGNRLPFEYVVHEDNGRGYCAFWPTGKLWRSSDIPNARVRTSFSALSAKLVIERGLLAAEGEASVGKKLRATFELPTKTKRMDVDIALDWDSSEPGRELRLYIPLALGTENVSYDTLFSTSDYDQALPERQHLYARWLSWQPASDNKEAEMLYDWRHVTRFVSAYEKEGDLSVTITPPQGLLRVEEGGVSFTLIEDRTTSYVDMFPDRKGQHVFHLSLTSHRGDWKSFKAWRFGWEHRGRFNPLVAVSPDALYPILAEQGKLIEMDGDNLVNTALKISKKGEDLVLRFYDAAGDGDKLGFRLTAPYLGHRPFLIGQLRHKAIREIPERALTPLRLVKSQKVNFLEDPVKEINIKDLMEARVDIRKHALFTALMTYERPRRSWVPTYEIRWGNAVDDLETTT